MTIMASMNDSTKPCSTIYRVAFRKKVYGSLNELQAKLDARITEYNEARPIRDADASAKTQLQTFLDAMPRTREKIIAA